MREAIGKTICAVRQERIRHSGGQYALREIRFTDGSYIKVAGGIATFCADSDVRPIDVQCPFCSARPGIDCAAQGGNATGIHESRKAAARRTP